MGKGIAWNCTHELKLGAVKRSIPFAGASHLKELHDRLDPEANDQDLIAFALFALMVFLACLLASTPLLRAVAAATPEPPPLQTNRASL